jgi:hypothetical protein
MRTAADSLPSAAVHHFDALRGHPLLAFRSPRRLLTRRPQTILLAIGALVAALLNR